MAGLGWRGGRVQGVWRGIGVRREECVDRAAELAKH